MHLLVRETIALDAADAAIETGQSPADILFLSFSDSDLGAIAEAWRGGATTASLRIADLKALRHPMSVDLYADAVVSGSRFVAVRLLGGLEYWRYGAEELAALCRREGVALALLPGDGRDDEALAALSTVPPSLHGRLDDLLREGGVANAGRFLRLAAHLAGRGADTGEATMAVPLAGEWSEIASGPPDTAIVFYRAHLLAGQTAPIRALADALRARGLGVRALFAASLKQPNCAAFVTAHLTDWRPRVVVNMTAFSARRDEEESPLAAAGVPILQAVLAGTTAAAWEASARGLGPSDLAMHVVLPELDGTLLAGTASLKAAGERDPYLQWAIAGNAPHPQGIAAIADRAAGWARLASLAPSARRVAIVLSDYPGAAADAHAGGHAVGHAVGLDSFASLGAILRAMRAAGYDAPDITTDALTSGRLATLSLADYEACLPDAWRGPIEAAWGPAREDPLLTPDGFAASGLAAGRMIVAIQPDRGRGADRHATYHDPDQPPCHAYVAFYLWLRRKADALIHLGAHGTLEWLPGKPCEPLPLTGGLPVIYPFIVNDPGEAACAKRRLGAVVIGHLTPPLRAAGLGEDARGEVGAVERLMEEYAAADGLDARRMRALARDMLARAASSGLLAEAGAASEDDPATQLARLDAWLCDLKTLQIRDGLHVFGEAAPGLRQALPAHAHSALDASPSRERAALLAALDGRFVAPGPAGAPTRGRADVLPTGRNLTTADPRLIPQPSALRLAERQADELLRRHRQEHGAWPRRLVLDLWASATLRTGGEDFALALVLLGARPVWDEASGRFTGITILALAELDRPRVDVTLRLSGLFRDLFAAQIALFEEAASRLAASGESPAWNPLAGDAGGRVFAPKPGGHGAGTETLLGGLEAGRDALGCAYLASGGFAPDGRADAEGFAARVAAADALVHSQDHAEGDMLEGTGVAAFVGGFAAAAASLGAQPALWQLDTSAEGAARVRGVAAEIARLVRGRAANPVWLAGMMRHGYRGGTEIARAVEALSAYARTLPDRFDAQFDRLHAATLGDATVAAFLDAANPGAKAEMAARFDHARDNGLWRPRRNDLGESS